MIYVLIPVFNRLPLTKSLISCLRRQVLSVPLSIIVINDGSSDETKDWLAKQADIVTLNGDSSLYWGGAIDLAMQHLMNSAVSEDWVLFMNNDTTVSEHFIQSLLDTALEHAPAAVGCVVRDETDHSHLLSLGVNIDNWRLLTSDIIETSKLETSAKVIEVDALSGRGALFSMECLAAVGGMRPKSLPHYLADYELSVRIRKLGWKLIVSRDAAVYTLNNFGSNSRASSWKQILFSVKSPFYLPAHLVFWWESSNWLQRLTLPFRLPLIILSRIQKSL